MPSRLLESGDLHVLLSGGSIVQREDAPVEIPGLYMEVLNRVAREVDDNTRPIFIRIFDLDLMKTPWVLRITWGWEFQVIHEDAYEFISYNERPDRSRLERFPIGQNPEFMETIQQVTAQFIPEVGELTVLVDVENTAYLILMEPATKQPPAVEDSSNGENRLPISGICRERGYHVLTDDVAIVPVAGTAPWHLRTCRDCQAVLRQPPK